MSKFWPKNLIESLIESLIKRSDPESNRKIQSLDSDREPNWNIWMYEKAWESVQMMDTVLLFIELAKLNASI